MAQAIGSSLIPFTATELDGWIHRRFTRIAQLVPDQIAINTLVEYLTYSQLNELSNHVATALILHPRSPQEKIAALFLDQGHLVMAAILGILKSGRVVVPLSPDSPSDILKYQWRESFNPVVITDRQNLAQVSEFVTDPGKVIFFDELDYKTGRKHELSSVQESQGNDLAMISYTSGSTGLPKGVMQSHRMILQTAHQNQKSYRLTPRDRSVVLASLGYGAATTQCFATLLSGGTLYLPNLRQWHIPLLVEKMQQEEINILSMPPIGLFRQILEVMAEGYKVATFRLALLGGDDLFQKDIDQFFSIFNQDTSLIYRFAGSEMNLIREIHLQPGIKFTSEKVPVGYAVPDKEVWLEDEGGRKVGVGEMGEIVVRSRYLAMGYWGQPDLTAERFKPDPDGGEERIYYTGDLGRINEQGQMEHLGRKDNMVKVHGFSVHLEMVDQALSRLKEVKEGAAAAVALAGGDKRLVGYLVGRGGRKPPVGELRRELSGLLPKHMQPSLFVWLEELPRTSTGKVDRKAFPPAPRVRPDMGAEMVAPRDEREAGLAEIWQRILQLNEVGVEDNFFDLGGDSLSSVQMVVEAEKLLGFVLPKCYFEKPTLANLVEQYLEWERSGGGHSRVVGVETRPEISRHSGKKVSKYKAAVRKILYREWKMNDILRRLGWFFDSLILNTNDLIINNLVLRFPYFEGINKISKWVGHSVVLKGMYRSQSRIFLRFLDELGEITNDIDNVLHSSTVGNIFNRLCMQIFLDDKNGDFIDGLHKETDPFWVSLKRLVEESSIDQLGEIFPVVNMEYLDLAYREGRGVILLTYHNTVNRLATLALSRRFNGELIPTISETRARRQSIYWMDNAARDLPARELNALKAGVALEGQHLLAMGKIIQFASDNEYSSEGHPVTLAGRRYFLRPGFAELAISTGAVVLPQYSVLKSDGRIQMTIMPPLIMRTGDRDSQVADLLDQYADFINTSWRTAPESIRWQRIMRHFDQPLAH